jgi:hypothetical protein
MAVIVDGHQGGDRLTSFRACFSSADSSGSFGTAASFFSSDFFAFALAGLLSDAAFVALVLGVPFVDFGVALEITLIFGFLTESDRCGVCCLVSGLLLADEPRR